LRNAKKIIALAYHDIVPGARYEISGFQSPDANIYKVDAGEFREHLLEIMRRRGVAVRLDATLAGQGKPLLLTFDDGGSSAVSPTAEILAEFGWPAHFFVVTDRIGDPGFLNPEQIRDLRRMGHVVGSHTCSHPSLISRLPDADLVREWRDSKRRLEDILGEKVEAGAVPEGDYTRRVGAAAAAAGLRFLFTSDPVISIGRVDGCRVFGRFSVPRGTDSRRVGEMVSQRLGLRVRSGLYWNGKKLLRDRKSVV
jgi:peptidoglycan/xylan/chitin deacetylase (PgdA/CDA1 family)